MRFPQYFLYGEARERDHIQTLALNTKLRDYVHEYLLTVMPRAVLMSNPDPDELGETERTGVLVCRFTLPVRTISASRCKINLYGQIVAAG